MGVFNLLFPGDYNALLASAVFEVTLAQSNPYANVAYFGQHVLLPRVERCSLQ